MSRDDYYTPILSGGNRMIPATQVAIDIRAKALDLAVKLVGSGQVATSTPTGTTLDIAENFESYLKGDLA